MKIEITANGKTIQTEINEEQAKILGLTIDKPKTGYERVEKGSTYFFNDGLSDMNRTKEEKDMEDQDYYNGGNYYNNKTIAKNNARADRLLCCLRQWQALNVIPNFCERCLNDVYFTTRETAQRAINVFKVELEWYFTQYQQRLDEE